MTTPQTTTPWHAAFPPPSNPNPPSITASTLLPRLQSQQKQTTPPTFLLIDLRRTDHEGGTIRTSLNLPAQTLYYSLSTLYTLCKSAGVQEVIFYCGACFDCLFFVLSMNPLLVPANRRRKKAMSFLRLPSSMRKTTLFGSVELTSIFPSTYRIITRTRHQSGWLV